jgi:hypothetical protein
MVRLPIFADSLQISNELPAGPIVFRILLVHPEEGVAELLVLEGDKPTRRVPPTPEEVESFRANLEARRAGRALWKGGAADTHDYAPA